MMSTPPNILIVDDNESNTALLEHLLRISGYEVRVAPDAESALAAIDDLQPDLLITDVQLPGMSGLSLAQELRRRPTLTDLRILAVSAFAMPADRAQALEAGCNEYMTKPIDTRGFAGVVANLLERR
jgi:CheY-like chemotaxis protein